MEQRYVDEILCSMQSTSKEDAIVRFSPLPVRMGVAGRGSVKRQPPAYREYDKRIGQTRTSRGEGDRILYADELPQAGAVDSARATRKANRVLPVAEENGMSHPAVCLSGGRDVVQIPAILEMTWPRLCGPGTAFHLRHHAYRSSPDNGGVRSGVQS